MSATDSPTDSAIDTAPTPPAASGGHPTLRARLVFRMAEVIPAGRTEATSDADIPLDGERETGERPEKYSVDDGIDDKAGPDWPQR